MQYEEQQDLQRYAIQQCGYTVMTDDNKMRCRLENIFIDIHRDGTFLFSADNDKVVLEFFGEFPMLWVKIKNDRCIITNNGHHQVTVQKVDLREILKLGANIDKCIQGKSDCDLSKCLESYKSPIPVTTNTVTARERQSAERLAKVLSVSPAISVTGKSTEVMRALQLTCTQVHMLKPEAVDNIFKVVRKFANLDNTALLIADALFDKTTFNRIKHLVNILNEQRLLHASIILHETIHFCDVGASIPSVPIETIAVAGIETPFVPLLHLCEGINPEIDQRALVRELSAFSASHDQQPRFQRRHAQEASWIFLKDKIGEAHQQMSEIVGGHEDIIQELMQLVLYWLDSRHHRLLVLSFFGPTGSGKNHIAEALAVALQTLMGGVLPRYLSYDVGTFTGGNCLWTMTGAMTGIVGCDQPSFMERASGNGVVLAFDECQNSPAIEEFTSFLMPILDDGCFRNGRGYHVSLGKQVIILTMNAGKSSTDERATSIGFNQKCDTELIRDMYADAYMKQLHPALRARVHHAFYIPRYSQDELLRICKKSLEERSAGRIAEDHLEQIAQEICQVTRPEMGIRGVINAIDTYLYRNFPYLIF